MATTATTSAAVAAATAAAVAAAESPQEVGLGSTARHITGCHSTKTNEGMKCM
jgi:hypothetical protein